MQGNYVKIAEVQKCLYEPVKRGDISDASVSSFVSFTIMPSDQILMSTLLELLSFTTVPSCICNSLPFEL